MSKRAGDITSFILILLGLACLGLWVYLRFFEQSAVDPVPPVGPIAALCSGVITRY